MLPKSSSSLSEFCTEVKLFKKSKVSSANWMILYSFPKILIPPKEQFFSNASRKLFHPQYILVSRERTSLSHSPRELKEVSRKTVVPNCTFSIGVQDFNPLFYTGPKVEKMQYLLDEVPFYSVKSFP